jgi:EAL domain-containing protein (putative c-di-GMP-specific phosphodiesterase class I)
MATLWQSSPPSPPIRPNRLAQPQRYDLDILKRHKPKLDARPGMTTPLGAAIAANDRETMAMVREAIAKRRLRLAYQPVVLTRDTQRIAFHEGLMRVLDPSGRIIPARDFMEAIEDSELGREVDCAALEMGLQTLAENPGLRLSLNMSARSIGYARWVDTLRRGLSLSATVPERLILEITEYSVMMVPEVVITFMEEMRAKGVAFAMDDFGAGFTAIRYFKEFFFDILKIDGQFIRGINTDPDNQVLTAALTSIGKHFEMFTVAESVETVEEANFLAGIGVDCLQGYLFGAPTIRPAWSQHDTAQKRA